MRKQNKVFIATSLDGRIADKNGGIDWLHSVPNPDNNDMGYAAFMASVDALIMGRTTFETVCGFDMDWPYDKPVFVLSNSLTTVPEKFIGKAEIVKGPLTKVINKIHAKGYHRLYIDGGKTIQSFLREDLIDELTITIIPTILGGGPTLFANSAVPLDYACVNTQVFLDMVVQNTFVRKR